MGRKRGVVLVDKHYWQIGCVYCERVFSEALISAFRCYMQGCKICREEFLLLETLFNIGKRVRILVRFYLVRNIRFLKQKMVILCLAGLLLIYSRSNRGDFFNLLFCSTKDSRASMV